jgi:hypothetical protein
MADSSGLNPEISLGIRPMEIQPGQGLARLGALVDVQQKMQETRMRGLELLGRQRAGEILAGAPDLKSGIDALSKDPLVGGFAGEVTSTMQSVQASMTSAAATEQQMVLSGLDAVLRGSFGALNDPSSFIPLVSAYAETLPPESRSAVMKALPNLQAAFFDGMPTDDPEAAGQMWQRRFAASLMATGITPETIRAATGTIAPQIISYQDAEGRTVTTQVGGPVTGPAGGGPIAAGPTTAEQAAAGATGAVAGGVESDMNAMATGIPMQAKAINGMLKTMESFQAGGGAQVRGQIASAMQGLKNIGMTGITQEMIDKVGNGDQAAQQEFVALSKQFVTAQLKAAVAGTGNVMRPEVDAFLESLNDATDPEAIVGLLNQAKYIVRLEADATHQWLQYKGKIAANAQARADGKDVPHEDVDGLGLESFPTWYEVHRDWENLPEYTPGGVNLGDASPKDVKGGDKTLPAESSGEKAGKKKTLGEIFGK